MAAPPIPLRPAPTLPVDRCVPGVPARPSYHPDDAGPAPSRPAPPISCRPFPPNPGPRSTSLRSDPTSPRTSSKRTRPVITVVEARPMDQVGFRDTSKRPTATSPSQAKKSLGVSNGLITNESDSSPPGKPAIPQRSASARHSMVAKPVEHEPEVTVCEKPLPVPPRPTTKPRAISMLVKLPPTIIKPKPHVTQHTQNGKPGEVTAFVNEGFNAGNAQSDATPDTQDGPGEVMLIDFDANIPPVPSPREFHSSITEEEPAAQKPVRQGFSPPQPDVDYFDNTTTGSLQVKAPSNIGSLESQAVATPLAFLNKQGTEQTFGYHRTGGGLPEDQRGLSVENVEGRTNSNSDVSRSSELDTIHLKNYDRNDGSQIDNPLKKTKSFGVAVLPSAVPPTEHLHVKNKQPDFSNTTKSQPPRIKPKPAVKPKPQLKPKPTSSQSSVQTKDMVLHGTDQSGDMKTVKDTDQKFVKPTLKPITKPHDYSLPNQDVVKPVMKPTGIAADNSSHSSQPLRKPTIIRSKKQIKDSEPSHPVTICVDSKQDRSPCRPVTLFQENEEDRTRSWNMENEEKNSGNKPLKTNWRPTIIRASGAVAKSPSAAAGDAGDAGDDPSPPLATSEPDHHLTISERMKAFNKKDDVPLRKPRHRPTVIRPKSAFVESTSSWETLGHQVLPNKLTPRDVNQNIKTHDIAHGEKLHSDKHSNERQTENVDSVNLFNGGKSPISTENNLISPPSQDSSEQLNDKNFLDTTEMSLHQMTLGENDVAVRRGSFDSAERFFTFESQHVAESIPMEKSHPGRDTVGTVKKTPPAKPPPPRPTSGPRKSLISPGVTSPTRAQSFKVPQTDDHNRLHRSGSVPTSKQKRKSKGLSPRLPPRPGPGHPLFHYVCDDPHGVALYDYDATQADELSFKAGDVIILVRQIDDHWSYGRNVDREGIFPLNFLDVIKSLPVVKEQSKVTPRKRRSLDVVDTGSGPRCRARFDYEGAESEDLSFAVGDIIALTERLCDDWLRGTVSGRTGIFPLSFVEIIEDLPTPKQEPKTQDALVTASYDYFGEDGDLSFKEGARIKVLHQVNEEWLFGELHGHQGSFPVAFVDRIPPNLPQQQKQFDIAGTLPNTTSVLPPSSTTETLNKSPAISTSLPIHNKTTQETGMLCVAKYPYDGETTEDLTFKAGDKITVTDRVDDDWFRGTLEGRRGMFPAAFVDVLGDQGGLSLSSSSGSTTSPPVFSPEAARSPTTSHVFSSKSDRPEDVQFTFAPEAQINQTPLSEEKHRASQPSARSLYDFHGETPGDLTFKSGEVIELIEYLDAAWLKGRIGARVGIFPASFVEVLTPLPSS